ncbi:MAG: hypothetical protein BGO67_12035 [Alphaproteobacteria bacterium 41-28]|nr:MAG: hypothetical protein BGO67_12035 [Alphaproteobacteria bacterium 41-28]
MFKREGNAKSSILILMFLGFFKIIDPSCAMQEEQEPIRTGVPKVLIPTINEQIKLYRAAYASHNHSEFKVNETSIEGLIPLVEIAHSYTAKLLPLEDPRHQKLAYFWEETQQSIKEQKLTIPYFKKMNLRLALLAARERDLSLFADQIGLLQHLSTSPDWENLDSYEAVASDTGEFGSLKGHSYPLCFEAIIYHERGVISLTTFLNQYLNPEMTLGLAAFPKLGKGAHENIINDPATLLFHDFAHWRDFVSDVGKKQERICQYWPQIQTVARKIYGAKNPADPATALGLFFLLHEYEPDASDIFQTKSSLDQAPSETIAISEREIFKRWVEGSQKSISEYKAVELQSIEHLFTQLCRECSCLEGLEMTCLKAERNQTGNDYNIEFEITRETSPFLLGRGTALVTVFPTENPYKTVAHISNVIIDGQNPAEEQEEIKVKRGEVQKVIEGVKKEVFTPKFYSDILYGDYIKMLNKAYGKEKFSLENSPAHLQKGLTEFLDKLYQSSLSVLK